MKRFDHIDAGHVVTVDHINFYLKMREPIKNVKDESQNAMSLRYGFCYWIPAANEMEDLGTFAEFLRNYEGVGTGIIRRKVLSPYIPST